MKIIKDIDKIITNKGINVVLKVVSQLKKSALIEKFFDVLNGHIKGEWRQNFNLYNHFVINHNTPIEILEKIFDGIQYADALIRSVIYSGILKNPNATDSLVKRIIIDIPDLLIQDYGRFSEDIKDHIADNIANLDEYSNELNKERGNKNDFLKTLVKAPEAAEDIFDRIFNRNKDVLKKKGRDNLIKRLLEISSSRNIELPSKFYQNVFDFTVNENVNVREQLFPIHLMLATNTNVPNEILEALVNVDKSIYKGVKKSWVDSLPTIAKTTLDRKAEEENTETEVKPSDKEKAEDWQQEEWKRYHKQREEDIHEREYEEEQRIRDQENKKIEELRKKKMDFPRKPLSENPRYVAMYGNEQELLELIEKGAPKATLEFIARKPNIPYSVQYVLSFLNDEDINDMLFRNYTVHPDIKKDIRMHAYGGVDNIFEASVALYKLSNLLT